MPGSSEPVEEVGLRTSWHTAFWHPSQATIWWAEKVTGVYFPSEEEQLQEQGTNHFLGLSHSFNKIFKLLLSGKSSITELITSFLKLLKCWTTDAVIICLHLSLSLLETVKIKTQFPARYFALLNNLLLHVSGSMCVCVYLHRYVRCKIFVLYVFLFI